MADLDNGFEAVALERTYVLRRWVSGLARDLAWFPFKPTVRGDRKRAFGSLWKTYERLNIEAADAAKEIPHGI